MSYDDLIDVVDDNDEVIDTKTKKEVMEQVLPHRGVNIILFNSKDEIFVHQRSLDKKAYPGYWAFLFGGFVDAGESHDEAALRELEEESGIKADKLEFLKYFRYQTRSDDWFGKLYRLISDENVKIQEEEIEKGFFIHLSELDDFIKNNKIEPSNKYMYKDFKELIIN
ncbi:hypothetical protein C0585_04880 [Candidatus Woesearchaeota archaeon]|nr:MAG: hypothetical protein C0585_04880 [Candidatus Woesearchaeota archaeon]